MVTYKPRSPLSTPTRLAAGLGLKELSYPFGIRPMIWFPRFHMELSVLTKNYRPITYNGQIQHYSEYLIFQYVIFDSEKLH